MSLFPFKNKELLMKMSQNLQPEQIESIVDTMNKTLEIELFKQSLTNYVSTINQQFHYEIARIYQNPKCFEIYIGGNINYRYSLSDMKETCERFQQDQPIIQKQLSDAQDFFNIQKEKMSILFQETTQQMNELFQANPFYSNIVSVEEIFFVRSFSEEELYFDLDVKVTFIGKEGKEVKLNSDKQLILKWNRKDHQFIAGFSGNGMPKDEDFYMLDYMNNGKMECERYTDISQVRDLIYHLRLSSTERVLNLLERILKK